MALAPTSEDVVKDAPPEEEDLEDGEIEDDDEEEEAPPAQPPPTAASVDAPTAQPMSPPATSPTPAGLKEIERPPPPGDKLKKKHLTEAEKSVLKLHKLERMEREKREKYRREQMHVPEPVDDYAVSLEKALAKVLKKDQKLSDVEEKHEEEPKRGKKRKKKDKHKKAKRNKMMELPKVPDEDIERRSPDIMARPLSDVESSDTESSTDKNELRKRQLTRELRRENAKNRRDRRDRSREREMQQNRQGFKKLRKRNVGICLYYLQGKCNDEHCQYSHDCVQPLKLELCKFYLLDCCAKGDKCLYMHSDFPCKYYHTGIPCPFGDDCKFAHGGPLAESVKQILFKHIETAPKEILGNFPRLSRENAHMMITQAQKNLEMKKMKDKEEKEGHAGHADRVDREREKDREREREYDAFEMEGSKGQGHAQDRKEKRHRPSRWQDPEPESPNANATVNVNATNAQTPTQQTLLAFAMGAGFNKDQDMRISSNGDVDMRSIHPTDIVNPNIFTTKPPPILGPNLIGMQGLQGLNLLQLHQQGYGMLPPASATTPAATPAPSTMVDIEQYKMDAAATKDKEKPEDQISGAPLLSKDVDLRVPPPNIASLSMMDTDIRHLGGGGGGGMSGVSPDADPDADEENALQIDIDMDEPKDKEDQDANRDDGDDRDDRDASMFGLPKVQRDLFARIQQQQKSNAPEGLKQLEKEQEEEQNIDWYSDDEDDNKLTIEHEDDPEEKTEEKSEEKTDSPAEPPDYAPTAAGGPVMDFSNIDIAEVSKLLSTIKENTAQGVVKDPRTKPRDPRLAREDQQAKQVQQPMTIYEQHTAPTDVSTSDRFLTSTALLAGDRIGRADVDLRIGMHFKSMGNYTPASEIDASINAHPAMSWKVFIVEIPKPDYTGLKLNASDAHTSGDPRLRKIFRLSTEEKDSPASPGMSPKAVSAPRVDPRRKKAMEAAAEQAHSPATYAQQLSTLQSSPFYQSLTSNQKLMLNQELANCNDKSGMSDPIVSAMLANLGLQGQGSAQGHANVNAQALNILNSLSFVQGVQGQVPQINLNVAPPNLAPNMGQGLLGPAPGHIQDFSALGQMNQMGNQMGFDPRVPFVNQAQAQSQPQNFEFHHGAGSGGNNSDNEGEFGPLYDNSMDYEYQQRGNRERTNRRGGRNNNNRNRNNYFRPNNRNNRNRNSPS